MGTNDHYAQDHLQLPHLLADSGSKHTGHFLLWRLIANLHGGAIEEGLNNDYAELGSLGKWDHSLGPQVTVLRL